MATKQIRVALWEYETAEGKRRRAYFGDIVDLPEDEIERGERAGVFGPSTGTDEALAVIVGEDQVDDVPPPGDAPPPDAPATHTVSTAPTGEPPADAPELERPKQAAPKDAWVAYAVSRGMDPAEADAATKVELIEQFGA